MKIYKELDGLGFFKWYCAQYGGLNYIEYKPVYDQLPLDNIITTELNACVFKFFRDKYSLIPNVHSIYTDETFAKVEFWYWIGNYDSYTSDDEECFYGTCEEAQLECVKKLIEIIKDKL